MKDFGAKKSAEMSAAWLKSDAERHNQCNSWVTPILDFESGKKIKFFSESGNCSIAYNVKHTPSILQNLIKFVKQFITLLEGCLDFVSLSICFH